MAVDEDLVDIVVGERWHLWNRDCLLVPHEYEDGVFQLLITSTEYPGQAGSKMPPGDYLQWWYARLRAWLPKVDHSTGVIVQNIKFKRTPAGWFPSKRVTDLQTLYDTLDLHPIDWYIWDKLNAPPSGNHDRYDRDEYEFVFVLARSPNYTFNKYRKPYAATTVGKAKPGNKMRQADVRGSHAGGHSNLHPDGARQGNVLRISSSGDQGRPRVKGGVFPREFAERFILTFSNPGDWIVDPCVGSGTSMVMARENGRFSVGCETDRSVWMTAYEWLVGKDAIINGSI